MTMGRPNSGRNTELPGGVQTYESTKEFHDQDRQDNDYSWSFYLHRILTAMARKGITLAKLEAMPDVQPHKAGK